MVVWMAHACLFYCMGFRTDTFGSPKGYWDSNLAWYKPQLQVSDQHHPLQSGARQLVRKPTHCGFGAPVMVPTLFGLGNLEEVIHKYKSQKTPKQTDHPLLRCGLNCPFGTSCNWSAKLFSTTAASQRCSSYILGMCGPFPFRSFVFGIVFESEFYVHSGLSSHGLHDTERTCIWLLLSVFGASSWISQCWYGLRLGKMLIEVVQVAPSSSQ
jgi:hypothetical protein